MVNRYGRVRDRHLWGLPIKAALRAQPNVAVFDHPDHRWKKDIRRATSAADFPQLIQASFDLRGKPIFEGACANCHGSSGVSPLTSYNVTAQFGAVPSHLTAATSLRSGSLTITRSPAGEST